MPTSTTHRLCAIAALSSMFWIACGSDSGAGGGKPDAIASSLYGDLCLPEPDYTPEELEALAMSPEVQAHVEPFGSAPPPDRQLHVAMADGVRIAVSLYYPPEFDPVASRAPVAYSETWYTRAVEARGMAIDLYRQAGFVVAIADPRGFGASFGSQSAFLTEAQRSDQREMIAWLAAQPWSSGQVAAVGISVSAMLAESMLASGAPALSAGVVRATEFDQYSENLFVGGIPNARIHGLIETIHGWMRGGDCLTDLAACPQVELGRVDADLDFTLLQAAVRDHQQNVEPGALRAVTYVDDDTGAGTFSDVSPSGRLESLRRNAVPTRLAAGWHDGATAQGALARYNALPEVPMQVSIGAISHLGGFYVDPFDVEAFLPAQPAAAEQFGEDVAFVKGVLAGEPVQRNIRYYVLGAGEWKSTEQWPPQDVRMQRLQFSERSLQRRPVREAGELEYRVDPTVATAPNHDRWASGQNEPMYYGDRRFAVGERVSFDAAPVQRDTELVGAAELCLAMRTDQTDGLVIAHLEDVAPDGRVTYLTEGEVRLLHRRTATGGCDPAPGTDRSFARADAAPVTPGELMHVEITMLPVAARIAKGHALRVSLSGADAGTFPLLSDTPATWKIAFGGQGGSTLALPLRPWAR